MAQYTIEDIEILRKKSGITYEEAVNLLEYHNGSLARALVDLEKNGRMKTEENQSAGRHRGLKGAFDYLYRMRVKVCKQDVIIVNISVLFLLLTAVASWPLVLIGLVCVLLLGYRMSVERNSRDFCSESFDSMVQNAKSNVHNTVSSLSKQFGQQDEKSRPEAKRNAEEQTAPRAESPASGTRPVNVQFPGGGSVDVREDADGYHEADIR